MPLITTLGSRDSQGCQGTNESVGPGTYSRELSWSVGEEAVVPFQSGSKRQNMAAWPPTPGPGNEPNRPQTGPAKLSVSAFRSRSAKTSPALTGPGASVFMPSTSKDNPGPGTYAVCKDLLRKRSLPQKEGNSHIPLVEQVQSSPAIPAAHDLSKCRFYGRDGNCLGPGDIDQESRLGKAAHTTNFHVSESERKLFEPSCNIESTIAPLGNPGPGTYNVRRKLTKGTKQPFRSQVPQQTETKSEGPGPGTYTFDGSDNDAKKELAFPGFRSESSRNGLFRSQDLPFSDPDQLDPTQPGPGHYPPKSAFAFGIHRRARSTDDVLPYNTKYHAVHNPSTISSLRNSGGAPTCGFSSSELKDAHRPIVKGGSPMYSVDDSMGSIAANLRQKKAIGRKGIFGSIADRSVGSPTQPHKESEYQPCPMHYQENLKSPVRRVTRSGFRSGVERIPADPTLDKNPSPDPGHYDVLKKANYSSKFRKPQREHISFGGGSGRWESKDVVGSTNSREMRPGPGEYEPGIQGKNFGGIAMSTVARLPGKDVEDLAFGNYDVRKSMVLGSFNVAGAQQAGRLQGVASAPMLGGIGAGGGAGGGTAGTRSRLNVSATHMSRTRREADA